MPDADILDHEELLKDDGPRSERWLGSLRNGLLKRVATRTSSDFALFRTKEFESQILRLGCYAVGEQSDAASLIHPDSFQIPDRKHVTCWHGKDPFSSWGMVDCDAGEAQEAAGDWLEWTDGERNFVRWVKQKAWFPIMLGEKGSGLVILVRGEATPFTFYDLVRGWGTAQQAISRSLRGSQHARFVRAFDCINQAYAAPAYVTMLQIICHCLSSTHGLGWNRVWMFEEIAGDFQCRAAIGEVTDERWAQTIRSLPPSQSLKDELTLLINERTFADDGLFVSCCSQPNQLVLQLTPDEVRSLFVNPNAPRADRTFPLALPVDKGLPGGARRFNASVQASAQAAGFSYKPDRQTLCLPLYVGETRYLVILGNTYENSVHPSPLLATVFLHQAAYVAREWLRANPKERRQDNDSSNPTVARRSDLLSRLRDASRAYDENDELREKIAAEAEDVLERARQVDYARTKE